MRIQKGTGIEIWTMTAWERSVSETMTTRRRRMKNSNIYGWECIEEVKKEKFLGEFELQDAEAEDG